MPIPFLQNLAQKTGKSIESYEKIWDSAKSKAKESHNENDKNFYAIVTTIFKRMAGIKEEDSAPAVTTDSMGGSNAIYPKKLSNAPLLTRLELSHRKKIKTEGTLFENICLTIEDIENANSKTSD